MEQRATVLVQRAVAARAPWLAKVGQQPADPAGRNAWQRRARAIAAYMERFRTATASPGIGDPGRSGEHHLEARAALPATIAGGGGPSVVTGGAWVATGVSPACQTAVGR